MKPIPFLDLSFQTKLIEKKVKFRWDKVIKNSSFVLNEDLINFENEFSSFTGIKYSTGVGNGGDAIEILVRSLNLHKKSTIYLPANTFIATATSVSRAGYSFKLIDINLEDGLIDIDKLNSINFKNGDCIIPVHLFGSMVDMQRVVNSQNKDLFIIEDASQAHGATYSGNSPGKFSHGATYSFYPGKNLGAFGDGGLINTNISNLDKKVKLLRNYGSPKKYKHEIVGFNSRLDPLQAVVLSEKLKLLNKWNQMRIDNHKTYINLLNENKNIEFLNNSKNSRNVYHLSVIKTSERDKLMNHLSEYQISTIIHYPYPLHKTGAFKNYKHKKGELKNSEIFAKQILSLPNYPGLKESQIEYVCEKINSYFK